MTKTFCDRCEKKIKNKGRRIGMKEYRRAEMNSQLNFIKIPFKEFCEPCFTVLESSLYNK